MSIIDNKQVTTTTKHRIFVPLEDVMKIIFTDQNAPNGTEGHVVTNGHPYYIVQGIELLWEEETKE